MLYTLHLTGIMCQINLNFKKGKEIYSVPLQKGHSNLYESDLADDIPTIKHQHKVVQLGRNSRRVG